MQTDPKAGLFDSGNWQKCILYPKYTLPTGSECKLLSYVLPDCLRFFSLSMCEHLGARTSNIRQHANVQKTNDCDDKVRPSITAHGNLQDTELSTLEPVILHINQEEFYCKTIFITRDQKKNRDIGIVFWARIEQSAALYLLQATPPAFPFMGICANMLRCANAINGRKCFGLHSLLKLELKPPMPIPIVRNVIDDWTQYAGLADVYEKSCELDTVVNEIVEYEETFPCSKICRAEEFYISGHIDESDKAIAQFDKSHRESPRVQFLLGCIAETKTHYSEAIENYNAAQQQDHLLAFDRELICHNELTKPLRIRYPTVFAHIEHGEAHRALTALRAAISEFPITGAAVLAYCLRHSGNPTEGLTVATQSLEALPVQSDTLGHKWLFHVELGEDKKALETATGHLMYYPTDPAASSHCIDSLLLCGRIQDALTMTQYYAIVTQNTERALYYFFRVLEQANSWKELVRHFEARLKFIRAPIPATLCYYGEALTECERLDDAIAIFNRAMAIAPENAEVVLGLSRTLCRANREDEAKEFLQTVLKDKNRTDSIDGRAFFVTLLAEIQRRTGYPHDSLETFSTYLSNDLVTLSKTIGPFPALEYIESLLEINDMPKARAMIQELSAIWPDDQFVKEVWQILYSNGNSAN